ncbi:MAG: hypothetical protein H6700_10365 [Myxococcales bacterium]|nr:hypothetical protein [Myxococcales bacterium]
MRSHRLLVVAAAACTSLIACSDDATFVGTDTGSTSGRDAAGGDTSADAGGGQDVVQLDIGGGGDTGGGVDTTGADAGGVDTGPVETTLPTLHPYSGGACPTLTAGTNTLHTGTVDRRVNLYLPDEPADAPLLFFYYGTGDSASNYGWIQQLADLYEINIAVPHAQGDMLFEWPVIATNAPANEVTYFDDMVSCIDASLGIDTSRIYVSGFSAGALWSTYLVMTRSDVVAAALIFSGGTGDYVHGYETPEFQTPVLGAYGGDSDVYGGFVNFKDQMTQFMDGLVADGHFVIGCNHNLGHTVPSSASDNGFDWGPRFLLAHAWGQPSPFEGAIPTYLPDYCERW